MEPPSGVHKFAGSEFEHHREAMMAIGEGQESGVNPSAPTIDRATSH